MAVKKLCGIYQIYNTISKHSYIGQSRNIKVRWQVHRRSAKYLDKKDSFTAIHMAMRKYGIDKFEFNILELCEPDKLNEREKYWVTQYDSYKNGYNETAGGKQAIRHIKLTEQKVSEIKQLLKTSNLRPEEIAERFSISATLVRRINSGSAWYEPISYPIRDEAYGKFLSFNVKKFKGKILQQYSNGQLVGEYVSYLTAAKLTYGYNYSSHICAVANGKRKSLLGDTWVWTDSSLEHYRDIILLNYQELLKQS